MIINLIKEIDSAWNSQQSIYGVQPIMDKGYFVFRNNVISIARSLTL